MYLLTNASDCEAAFEVELNHKLLDVVERADAFLEGEGKKLLPELRSVTVSAMCGQHGVLVDDAPVGYETDTYETSGVGVGAAIRLREICGAKESLVDLQIRVCGGKMRFCANGHSGVPVEIKILKEGILQLDNNFFNN
jgi:hypothetical protein